MCGIAGIVRFDRPAQTCREELRAMRAQLAHRGPDGMGEAFLGAAALAHVRLAMLDAVGGAQPMSDGRFTIVYNGELYDHAALRARLPGPWRTRSDTETLLAAWRAWGEGCVDALDGMYAFFVWDAEREVGFAVRDRLGVKPLAYTTRDGFAFASEAHALAPRPRADHAAIIEYLVAPAFSGVARSPFAGVDYLPPGHVLRVDRQGVTTRRYWRWRAGDEAIPPQALRAALTDGVRACLNADVPLGVFLSGGLDSTAIAALAGELPAFTVTFAEQGSFAGSRVVISDDTPWAREAARALAVAHHEVPAVTTESELAALARINDALPAWEQELSQRALARAAARHVKGVLVGDAADETHYGYHFVLDADDPGEILRRLGSVPVRDRDAVARLTAEYRAIGDTTQLLVERWLPRLLHNGDIHAMAFGLEARVPFAATPLIELAMRAAPARAMDKALLREALRGVVPEPIRLRKKSALPKDQGADYRAAAARVLAEPHPVVRELVELSAARSLVAGPRLDEAQRAQLFRVICLHHWAVAHNVNP